MRTGTVTVNKLFYKQYIGWRKTYKVLYANAARHLEAVTAQQEAFRLHLKLFYPKNGDVPSGETVEVSHPLMVRP